MSQAIISQEKDIKAQSTREGAPRENPDVSNIASSLRDFTRIRNLLVYFMSKTNDDPQEFVDEVHKILCSMGVNEKERMSWMHTISCMWLRYGTRCV